jgi:hypothetical protein
MPGYYYRKFYSARRYAFDAGTTNDMYIGCDFEDYMEL